MNNYAKLCDILINGMLKQYDNLANLKITNCSSGVHFMGEAKEKAKAFATIAKTMHKMSDDVLALERARKQALEADAKKESEKT